MAGQPIDYTALAKQVGATSSTPPRVDYAALAKQAGAVSSQPAPGGAHSGLSDDDLIRSYGFDPAVIKQSPHYQEAVKRWGSGIKPLLTDPNRKDLVAKLANSPLGDLGQGALDVLKGASQLSTHLFNKLGLVSDADTAYLDLINKVQERDYLENVRHGRASGLARLAGNVAVPVPGVGVIRGEGVAANLGRAAASGATAAATQPTEGGEGYWRQKGAQVATGAAVGTGTAGAATLVGKGTAKVINAAQGNMSKEAADVIRAGAEHGIETTFGDVSQNPTARNVETAMEKVPGLGVARMRQRQQLQIQTAAHKLQESRASEFKNTPLSGFDDVTRAANEGDEYARQLADKLQNAGNDPDKILQASIGLSNFRTRQEAEQLYNEVQNLVEQNSLGEVPLGRTGDALKRALTEAQASKIPNKAVIRLLKTVQENVASGNGYGAIRQLRSDLGDEIRSYYAGNNAIIGEKGVGYLQRLRSAVEKDLSEFAEMSGVPEVQEAAKAADSYYKAARVPFKDGMLAQAAVDTEPDQIFQRFIKAGKGDRAQKFYDALDQKGRAAVQYEMVANAINKAVDTGKPMPGTPYGGIFSPAKLYNELDNLKEAYGVFFRGPDKWKLDGFKNLMAHVERAGQFAENPPTGQRVTQYLGLGGAGAVGAGAWVNLPATASAVGTMGVILAMSKALLMTDAGKGFLFAASSLKPGSPAMEKLLQRIIDVLPKAGAKAATQSSQQ